jgi:hypothetical protein
MCRDAAHITTRDSTLSRPAEVETVGSGCHANSAAGSLGIGRRNGTDER